MSINLWQLSREGQLGIYHYQSAIQKLKTKGSVQHSEVVGHVFAVPRYRSQSLCLYYILTTHILDLRTGRYTSILSVKTSCYEGQATMAVLTSEGRYGCAGRVVPPPRQELLGEVEYLSRDF